MAVCPECEGPLVRGRFCRACGWDGDLEDGAYLDGVDLPEGHARDDAEAAWDHDQALRQAGRAGPSPLRVLAALVALALVVWIFVLGART